MTLPGQLAPVVAPVVFKDNGVTWQRLTTTVAIPFKLTNVAWKTMCATGIAHIWRSRSRLVADDRWADTRAESATAGAARKIFYARHHALGRTLSAHIAPADTRHIDRLWRLALKHHGNYTEIGGSDFNPSPRPGHPGHYVLFGVAAREVNWAQKWPEQS